MTRALRFASMAVVLGSVGLLAGCGASADSDTLRQEIADLRAQIQAVDAKATQAQADAARCSDTCSALQEQMNRQFGSSLRK